MRVGRFLKRLQGFRELCPRQKTILNSSKSDPNRLQNACLEIPLESSKNNPHQVRRDSINFHDADFESRNGEMVPVIVVCSHSAAFVGRLLRA